MFWSMIQSMYLSFLPFFLSIGVGLGLLIVLAEVGFLCFKYVFDVHTRENYESRYVKFPLIGRKDAEYFLCYLYFKEWELPRFFPAADSCGIYANGQDRLLVVFFSILSLVEFAAISLLYPIVVLWFILWFPLFAVRSAVRFKVKVTKALANKADINHTHD